MAFDHTAYAHRTGRRSRPRNRDQMATVFADLDEAILVARAVRAKHRHRNERSRTRDLQIARAKLEAAMIPARQESARNSKDPERRRRYGASLTERTARVRYEKLRLMKMLGEWS